MKTRRIAKIAKLWSATDMKKLLIIMLLSGVLSVFGWGVQRVEVAFGWGPLRVEAENSASLFNACANGNLAEAKQLLDKGADINAKTKDGHTALMRAKWHPDVVRLLKDHGAEE